MALCGFDSNPARRHLGAAEFLRVFESGLGGGPSNFDTVSFHALPNPRPPEELWPDLDQASADEQIADRNHMVENNPGYAPLGGDECGRFELAGKAIAVPFVGATAASLVVSEVVRVLHGGPAYTDIKLSLGSPQRLAGPTRNYGHADLAGSPIATSARGNASPSVFGLHHSAGHLRLCGADRRRGRWCPLTRACVFLAGPGAILGGGEGVPHYCVSAGITAAHVVAQMTDIIDICSHIVSHCFPQFQNFVG